MKTPRNMSIQSKQTLVMMLTSGIVLLLACAAFTIYEVTTFRASMRQNLSTLADVVIDDAAAALDFNDAKSAEETLAALHADPDILGACIYTANGAVFARYERSHDPVVFAPPAHPGNLSGFNGERLILTRLIVYKGETIGALYMESDMKALTDRVSRYAGICALIFIVSVLVAFALSHSLQRLVSDPVLHLARVTRAVTAEKNYGLRATKRSNDELGDLVDGFNEMLGQIQVRDAALQAARDELEARVAERTTELASSNQALQTENAERKKAERQLSVEYALSRILTTSDTVDQVAPRVLQGFCETLAWDMGVLWMVDHKSNVLHCAAVWAAPGLAAEEFKTRTRALTMPSGSGLPGRAWMERRPAWVHDAVDDPSFARAPSIAQLGMRTALAFPIAIGDRAGAVAEFFSRAQREEDEGLLCTCANLASQLGQFFERKRVEAHLLQSQKMETVGKLAGGIAHEFNSIMTAIIGHSELLLIDLAPENPMSKNAREIRQAADRAAGLTRQLLAYGRKQILRPEILNLNSIIASMENVLRHLVGKGCNVSLTLDPQIKTVKADAGQIEQVIINIVMNAADAMPNGGALSLETGNVVLDDDYVRRYPDLKAGEYVMLAITDTGSGMSEAVRARLFEPFFSTKSVGQGTGLGLATCYGIVKQSGGHISAYSELARGASFKIYLPKVETTAAAPAKRGDMPALPRGTETILLVEDDPSLREMAATLLTRLGYTVLTAANGVEALNIRHQPGASHVDLLFTDVVMPHMSGKELSDRIRVLNPLTRILFTSAYTETSIVHQGVLHAGVTLLQKPFTPSALAVKVREVLDADHPQ
jgi:two-component system, cell cycle sensor histidine kinase and response regulator CckA